MDDGFDTAELLDFLSIELGAFWPFHTNLEDLDGLDDTIKANGIETPLVVWCVPQSAAEREAGAENPPWHYELVDGFRRHAALCRLRVRDRHAVDRVPVIRLLGPQRIALVAQAALNREHAEEAPLEMGECLARAHAQVDVPGLARALQWPQERVWRYLGFAQRAAPELKHAVASGELTFDLAWSFVARNHAEQREALSHYRRLLVTQGGLAAHHDQLTRVAGGRRPRPADLYAMALAIDARACAEPRTVLEAARSVLAWALGEGAWPDLLSRAAEFSRD